MMDDRQPTGTMTDETPRTRQTRRWRPFVVAGLAILLVAVVAGAIWGVTRGTDASTSATHGTASATATPAPRILYQADWSHGADGWHLPAGAQIVNGKLNIASADALSLHIPYVPTTPNYAVEMDYLLQATMKGGRFGITGRTAAGDQLYMVEMQCSPHTRVLPGAWDPTKGACPGIALELTPGGKYPGGYWVTDYAIGTGPQTFRVEKRGNTVLMCPVVDGCDVPVTSPKPMAASQQVSIETRAVKIEITRVVVTTL